MPNPVFTPPLMEEPSCLLLMVRVKFYQVDDTFLQLLVPWYRELKVAKWQTSFKVWLSLYRIHLQCRRPWRPRFNPWDGKIPWRRNGYLLQYSCLENPMDRGAWRATAHGVGKTWTRLDNYARMRAICVFIDFHFAIEEL